MAAQIRTRPFDNFRLAITDPLYFFGRCDLLSEIQRSPFEVRVLLGGSRMGKTSALNGVRLHFLDTGSQKSFRAFPILFDFQREQPKSLENFLYLLIARLREAIANPQQEPSSESNWRQTYRRFLRQLSGAEVGIFGIKLNVTNPNQERCLVQEDFRQDLLAIIKQLQKHEFEGVCFLFDGAEFIISQDWANHAWSYLRWLKDMDTAISPFLGLVLSGYRDLKNYQQRTGSPLLNIAKVEWLSLLTESEIRTLIARRCENEQIQLTEQVVNAVIVWAGCHPYLTQQMLNAIFDNRRLDKSRSPKDLIRHLIRQQHDKDFSALWDGKTKSYGFSEKEQAVYLALVKQRQGSGETLASQVQLSFGEVEDTLEVLAGTGVIRQLDDERYAVGAKLFEQWVAQDRRLP
ncbi:helix-turn-helix domain-containing protein [Microcoleus sp. ZQ-A2]|nr:ATP-binding protein [Microcoleus sp. FACHB-1]